jgi:uncharacterized protein
MLYLDSSALVKRYIREAGSDLVQTAIRSDPYVATSIMSVVEVRAAIAAAVRAGRIPDVASVLTAFRNHREQYLMIGVNARLVDEAAEVAERHALRGYDAVQLASALTAARATSGAIRFGAFDRTLHRAASAEGLALLPLA